MVRPAVGFVVGSLVAAALVASCAGTEPLQPFESSNKSWPAPPDTRRIAFVGEFTRSADLGIKPGVWGRLVDLAAGSHEDAMVRPMAVAAADDNNTIYVADPGARCVHRFDLLRARYACLSLRRNRMLVSPVGLTVTPDGTLYVSDSSLGALYRLESGDKWLEPFGDPSDLQQPTGLAWDEGAMQLLVTDTGAQSIKAFDASGNLLREFGRRGGMPGEVNYPTYLWLDSGNELLVTDSLNFRIQRFDERGEFISSFGENGDKAGSLARPKGVATDAYGHVYVIDALFHAMQIFDGEGGLLMSIGTRGRESGQFWLPNGIYISADNTIYVADSYNRRVQVFRYVGPGA
jgi:sugar lactone lactonase YvrE